MASGLIGELWAFMRERKKLWLLPILIVLLVVGGPSFGLAVFGVLVVVGGLLVFAQGSALAPFIYTIF